MLRSIIVVPINTYIYTLVTELVDVRSEQVADISNDRDREQYLISKILIVCSNQT